MFCSRLDPADRLRLGRGQSELRGQDGEKGSGGGEAGQGEAADGGGEEPLAPEEGRGGGGVVQRRGGCEGVCPSEDVWEVSVSLPADCR